jgi:hypothetical protein
VTLYTSQDLHRAFVSVSERLALTVSVFREAFGT